MSFSTHNLYRTIKHSVISPQTYVPNYISSLLVDDAVYSHCIRRRGHHGCVNCMAFSPDGRYLVSGSDDTRLLIWDNVNLKIQIPSLEIKTDHWANIFSCEFDFTQKFLLSGSFDGRVIRTPIECPPAPIICLSAGAACYQAQFLPETNSVAVAAFDEGTIRVIDFRVDKGKAFQGYTASSAVYDVSVRPSGYDYTQQMAYAGENKTELLDARRLDQHQIYPLLLYQDVTGYRYAGEKVISKQNSNFSMTFARARTIGATSARMFASALRNLAEDDHCNTMNPETRLVNSDENTDDHGNLLEHLNATSSLMETVSSRAKSTTPQQQSEELMDGIFQGLIEHCDRMLGNAIQENGPFIKNSTELTPDNSEVYDQTANGKGNDFADKEDDKEEDNNDDGDDDSDSDAMMLDIPATPRNSEKMSDNSLAISCTNIHESSVDNDICENSDTVNSSKKSSVTLESQAVETCKRRRTFTLSQSYFQELSDNFNTIKHEPYVAKQDATAHDSLRSDADSESERSEGVSHYFKTMKSNRSISSYFAASRPVRSVNRATFSGDGSYVLVLRRREPPLIYHVEDPRPLYELRSEGFVNSKTLKTGCWLSDDKHVAIGSENAKIHIWRLPEHADLAQHRQDGLTEIIYSRRQLSGHLSIVNCCASSPKYPAWSGLPFLASSGIEKMIRLWLPTELDGNSFIDEAETLPQDGIFICEESAESPRVFEMFRIRSRQSSYSTSQDFYDSDENEDQPVIHDEDDDEDIDDENDGANDSLINFAENQSNVTHTNYDRIIDND